MSGANETSEHLGEAELLY